jgi:Undecaprenyl-phosphate glucose phosphotransferase
MITRCVAVVLALLARERDDKPKHIIAKSVAHDAYGPRVTAMANDEISLRDAPAARYARRRHLHDPIDRGPRPTGKLSSGDTGTAGDIVRLFGLPSLARLKVSAHAFPIVAATVEFILLAVCVFEAGSLYQQLALGRQSYQGFYLFAAFCLSAMFIGASGFAREYSIKRLLSPREQFRSLFLHWNSAYSLFVFALFMTHATDFYSRGSILVQYGAGLSVVVIVRLLLAAVVQRGLEAGTLEGKNVAVVGVAGMVNDTIQRLHSDGQGVKIVSAIVLTATSSATTDGVDETAVAAEREEIRAAVEALERIAQRQALDEIIISCPWSANDRIQELLEGMSTIPATIHLAPNSTSPLMREPHSARVGRMRTILLARAPLTRRDLVLKRVFDTVGAAALLVVALPLFAAIALLIKLDSPGPVFFRQSRHGFSHREFRVIKFRTMSTLDDGALIRQASRNDERITRVGRFLRSANLDELPQLINVLAGQMSLVGPRPHALAHTNEYEERISQYARRHKVKPGITGWAQVNGYRGETSSIDKMLKRVDHDLYYIDHWSLSLDIRILVMTVFSPRSYRNAY